MEQVWKCSFCSQTNKDKEKIENHEKECKFDPEKKVCYTCENCYDEWGTMCCKKRLDCNDIIDESLPCPYWELEK